MDNLAYVSSTVLRSVSCRQTGPKNQGLRGTAQGTLSSSAGLVNCFSGSHNLLKQRRRFLAAFSAMAGSRSLREPAVS